MAEFLLHLLKDLPAPLVVAIMAMVPVVEMQAAFPVALGVYKFPMSVAYPLIVLSNMVPAVVVLFGWDKIIRLLEQHFPKFHAFMVRYHDRLHTRWEDKIDRYGPIAVFLFVAIPGPFSGVWSGSMIAWIFSIHKKPAFLSIFLGVLVAAAIVASITTGALRIF